MTGNRSALIVATYEYQDERLARLRAPERDAEALAEVLADPDIGGFEVTTILNRPWHEVSRAVAAFFRDRHAEDLVLLHFSCHGLKDETGELYFAATDTTLDLLEATAIASSSVNRAMDRSRAGRVLLLLDCCYSGAFARGLARAGGGVDVNERLGGRGRAVITASTALQFAFEGDSIAGGDPENTQPSVFTTALVEGLRTGEADRDLDGWVSLDELYSYIHDEVTRITPDQTPTKWAFDIAGDIRVAKRGRPVSQPAELPQPLLGSLESLFAWERAAVIDPLTELLQGAHPGRALAARLALENLAMNDDSDRVKARARAALALVSAVEEPHPIPLATRPPMPGIDVSSADEGVSEIEAVDEVPAAQESDTFEDSTANAYETERPAEPRPEMQGHHKSRRPSPRQSPARHLASLITSWGRGVPRTRLWLGITAAAMVIALVMWSLIRPESAPEKDPRPAQDGVSRSSSIPDTSMVLSRDGKIRQLVELDTRSGQTRSLPADKKANRPAISPDRKEIAYLLSDGGGPGVVKVIQSDGNGRRMLLSKASSKKCPRTVRPTWSPDSQHLALICSQLDGAPLGIWVTNRAGTTMRQVLDLKEAASFPTWGGNGRIYFIRFDPVGLTADHIYSVPASGHGEPVRATDGGEYESNPDWGVHGLLYVSSKSKNEPGDIAIRNVQGTTRLTHTHNISSATWSPDEKSVAWLASDSSKSAKDIWIGSFSQSPDKSTLANAKPIAFAGEPGVPTWGSR